MGRIGFNIIGKLRIRGNGSGGGAERSVAPADAAEFKAPTPGSPTPPVSEVTGTIGPNAVSPTLSQELAGTEPAQAVKPAFLAMADGTRIALTPEQDAYLGEQVGGTGDHASFSELSGQLLALGIPADKVGDVRSRILDLRKQSQMGDKHRQK